MSESKKWIVDWFIKNGNLNEKDIMEKLDDNYIENGFIDSFGFIQLLSDISETFGTEFADQDLDDEKFFTINGLAILIGEFI